MVQLRGEAGDVDSVSKNKVVTKKVRCDMNAGLLLGKPFINLAVEQWWRRA